MARDYRSETVAAIYAAINGHSPLDETFPRRKLLENDSVGRKKGLYFSNPGDYPYLQIVVGDSDSGILFGATNFADEETGIPDDFDRQAEVTLKFLYDNRQDDTARSAMETECLAAITAQGRALVSGIVSATFRRRSGAAQVEKMPGVAFGTTLIITFTYNLPPADMLP